MKIKIFTTPSSITIRNEFNDALTVIRTSKKIELHSVISDGKKNNVILSIQKLISERICKPNQKDNYKVRFEKLKKELSEINTHSFLTIKRVLS